MTPEERTHGSESAIDDELIEPSDIERARHIVAGKFPVAAVRIYAGEWDQGPWIEAALQQVRATNDAQSE